jgi:hypothetical protein
VGLGSFKCTWFLVTLDNGCNLTYLDLQVPVEHGAATMDVDASQDEQLNKAIAESLAMSTTVDEADELIPPESFVRKDNR